MGARDLLEVLAGAGLSVSVDGGNLVIRPRELLSDELRVSVRAHKTGLVALLKPAGANEDASVGQSQAADAHLRRVRMMGLDRVAAEEVFGRLKAREIDADDRRLCVECLHFAERGRLCRHPHLVAIQAPRELGQMALQPQRCAGFKVRAP
jgi:hypothetical protein